MTLNLMMPEQQELKPRITVFGVGGAGGNAVNNMIEKQLDGVEFVVANTDAQALQQAMASSRVQMGVKVTEGLGAGARPAVGAAAAEESIEEIVDHLAGAHMCFITAGMGGGTGTGAAPIIAQAARELGVLTVGVVTKPFQFEGGKRMRQAEEGVEALQKVVDTLIIIPNQNLFRLANEKTTFTEAFSLADDVLYQGVKGVTDLMVRPGLIYLDFADVRAVMYEMGKAMMGTGEADGEDRAVQAAEKAIANPLLDEISLRGAKGVLINITGGHDLTLFELDEAANRIREEVDPDANIIVGSTLDTEMEGKMRVSVVATGIDATDAVEVPVPRRTLAAPLQPEADVAAAASAPAEPGPAPVQMEAPEPRQMHQPQQHAQPQPQPQEPSLFNDFEERVEAEPADDFFSDKQAFGADDLPEPVYSQPQTAQQAVQNDHVEEMPRARVAGEPTPEAMARLRAAVSRMPKPNEERARVEASHQQQQQQRAADAERPRFGINSLIGRMTGSAEEGGRQPEPVRHEPERLRAQPPRPAAARPADADDDQEKIEIPAFLRRQAN
jgi:cell division protein FtsZ